AQGGLVITRQGRDLTPSIYAAARQSASPQGNIRAAMRQPRMLGHTAGRHSICKRAPLTLIFVWFPCAKSPQLRHQEKRAVQRVDGPSRGRKRPRRATTERARLSNVAVQNIGSTPKMGSAKNAGLPLQRREASLAAMRAQPRANPSPVKKRPFER